MIGVLIWWILRQRRSSYEGASPSSSPLLFAGSNLPTLALVNTAEHVPHRPPHASYPSYVSFTPPTSRGTGNTENGHGNHNGALMSHHYATAGVGLHFSPPSLSSSTSVGLPSNRTSQKGVLQSSTTNTGHPPQLSGLSLVLGQATLEPTPYILPPPSQGVGPGYPPPKAAIRSLPQPNPAVQAHMTLPLNTDLGCMITAIPGPMSPETPNPPSYMASQVEEQLRRAVNVTTAGTHASSNSIIPTQSTPEQRGDLLPTVPQGAATPHDGLGYPYEGDEVK